MKKIISILFLFLLCISCYFIFKLTEKKELNVMSIGDSIAKNNYLLELSDNIVLNNEFTNKDYRVIDLLNIIKYNEEKINNNKEISIHQQLKKTDILIISIGMNDITYKLNDNTKDIYTYLNNMLNNYEEILKEINHYDYNQVFIIGYYNYQNKYNDIYTYTNYKLKQITSKYHFTFIDTNKIINNNNEYYKNNQNFNLNNKGYYEIYKLIVEKLKKT